MKFVTRVVLVLAYVGALVTAAAHVATYGPSRWASTAEALWPFLFFGIFPVFGYVVIAINARHMPLDVLIGDMPLWLKVGEVVLLLFVVFNYTLSFRALQGSHTEDPIYTARLFTGHALFFYAAAAALAYQIDRANRGLLNANRAPRDDALEQDPLPRPLSRTLVLQSALSREECVKRLAGWRGLRGDATVDVFRMDLGRTQRSMVYAVGRFEGETPTFIRLLLTFKRFDLIVIGSTVLLLPLVAFMLGPVGFAWPGILFVILFAGGGNIVYGIFQMRSLETQIRKATESQPAAIA